MHDICMCITINFMVAVVVINRYKVPGSLWDAQTHWTDFSPQRKGRKKENEKDDTRLNYEFED